MAKEGKKRVIVILSDGVWRRPQDTPAGKAGWIGEITFCSDPTQPFIIKKNDIRERFETKEEAEAFVKSEMYNLTHNTRIRVKHYVHEAKINNYTETYRRPSVR